MNDNGPTVKPIDQLRKEREARIIRIRRRIVELLRGICISGIGILLLWFAWPFIAFAGKVVLQGIAALIGTGLLISGISILAVWILRWRK